jgi:hypothetical protein
MSGGCYALRGVLEGFWASGMGRDVAAKGLKWPRNASYPLPTFSERSGMLCVLGACGLLMGLRDENTPHTPKAKIEVGCELRIAEVVAGGATLRDLALRRSLGLAPMAIAAFDLLPS